ncbi:MAG TPA: bifunctional glycosyltransferase family 2/GtrA family protein [Firmicutes bacterium]|nr:bifunctional glycosyltransferase family 2/GtrA family protein [Bacillota bacterium]
MDSVVLIPSLNPDGHLPAVVQGCLEEGLGDIVVVDDGSGPSYAQVFQQVEALGAVVVRHDANRGKGAALKTGLRAALERFPALSGVVTADADGQHLPQDIRRVAQALAGPDHPFVLGIRDFSGGNVPWRSRMGNRITSFFVRLGTGLDCPDTQTGLRGLPRALFQLLLDLPGERYEYETNMLTEVTQARYPIQMIPIQTVYEDNNRGSHFRTVVDSARIYQRPLKYAASSLVGCGVDLLLFALLAPRLGILAATALARCVSGYVNFKLNQRWSFQVRKRTWSQFWKYALLWVCAMLASGGLVTLLRPLPLPLTLIKALVDGVLFVVNYWVQRRLIFREGAGAPAERG